MTIEIISLKNPSAAKFVVCKNCGAELKYFNNDVQKIKEYDYSGSCDIVKIITCPACANNIRV